LESTSDGGDANALLVTAANAAAALALALAHSPEGCAIEEEKVVVRSLARRAMTHWPGLAQRLHACQSLVSELSETLSHVHSTHEHLSETLADALSASPQETVPASPKSSL
jgi:hypothetical protein